MTMIDWVRSLCRDESGATAIEYTLIAALISITAIIAMQSLGVSISGLFTSISSVIDSAIAGSTGP